VKALGLLLAVLLSVRARSASQRRQQCVDRSVRMLMNALDLLSQLRTADTKKKFQPVLEWWMCEAAWFITRRCGKLWENAQEVQPKREWDIPQPSILPPNMNPGLVTFVGPRIHSEGIRDVLDQLFASEIEAQAAGSDKISATRRFHRNCDKHLDAMVGNLDALVAMEEESTPVAYQWLLQFMVLVYVSFYPWCVTHETAFMLLFTTAIMSFVYYGLNTITHEHEEPFGQFGADLNLQRSYEYFFDVLAGQQSETPAVSRANSSGHRAESPQVPG